MCGHRVWMEKVGARGCYSLDLMLLDVARWRCSITVYTPCHPRHLICRMSPLPLSAVGARGGEPRIMGQIL